MIKTGIVTKTNGQIIWFSTSPEGAQCADCSCERPVRVVQALLDAGSSCIPGDQVIVENKPAATFIAAGFGVICLLSGAVAGYTLPIASSEILHAALALAGATLGLGVATLIALPFRRFSLPKARKVTLQLIRPLE